jgi:flagellar export protein FliJ
MPFRFPLAAVLLVREHTEKREERALQKIQFEWALVVRQIEELSAEIANAHNVREQALQEPIAAFELHSFHSHTQAAAEKKKKLLHRLQTLDQERKVQMKIYQAAHSDRETLTDMLDKQRDAYEQEQVRNQQKQLDDIFMARRHRS